MTQERYLLLVELFAELKHEIETVGPSINKEVSDTNHITDINEKQIELFGFESYYGDVDTTYVELPSEAIMSETSPAFFARKEAERLRVEEERRVATDKQRLINQKAEERRKVEREKRDQFEYARLKVKYEN